uniref:Carboxylesterase type B domain-containing protein n=1 Tax=Ciona savignyi TaxID=51511 RepID=H2Z9T4_CIOSA
MIGTDSQEGYAVSRVIPVPISYNRLVSLFERMWHDLSTSVVQLYAPDPSLSDYRDALGNMLTHFGFTCPSRYLARAAVATKGISKKVYSFINYHPLSGPGCPAIVGSLEVLCGYAFHASELSYVWRTGPIIGQTYTEDEIPYVNSWTNYIGNFVHSGNVNKGMDAGLQSELGSFAEWPTYDAPIAGSSTGSDDWLSAALDAPYPSIEQEPLDQYCSFWDNIGYDYKIFGQVLADALNMVLEDKK